MKFRCLGPLAVEIGGDPIALGGGQQRHILAVLVANAPDRISTDALILDIWGEEPPATARKTIQGYISALRKVLPDDCIVSDAVGYRLVVEPSSIDAVRFAGEVRGAAMLAPSERITTLTAALEAWSGSPYEEFESDLLRPERVRLEGLHMTAIMALAEARIYTGEAPVVMAELADLTERHPLNERLWVLRALALYRMARQMEALRVLDEARRILAVEGGLEPSPEMRRIEQRVLDQDPVLLGADALEAEPDRKPGRRRNPYRGLKAFDTDDAEDFHGRETLVRRLVETVTARETRLAVLAGPSGSGKSSVARAGLVPELVRAGFEVTVVFPDEAGEPLAVAGRSKVIVVDQLEEIFLDTSREDRRSILDLICDAVERDDGPTVLATVRADVLDRILEHRRAASQIQHSTVFVTPLRDDEVREIVSAPAGSVGVGVEPELVATFVARTQGRASNLPMIQYALTDLFDRAGGDTLTLQGLEAAGGIGGALAGRADDTFEQLAEGQRTAVRQVFLRLVHIDADGTTFRRRAQMVELDAFDPDLSVIDAFLRARLLTVDRTRNGERTVEIAHEAILREWPTLRSWVDEAADSIRRHRQLAEAAQEWTSAGHPDSMLLAGGRLARFADRTEVDLDLAPTEEAFLAASINLSDSQARNRKRRRTAVTIALGTAALVSAVLAGVALVAWGNARESAEIAQHNEQLARSNEMSAAAQLLTPEDPELGILLAVQAVLENPSEPSIEQRLALRAAIRSDRLAAIEPVTGPGRLFGMDLAPDGSSIAVLTESGLRVIDTSTWTEHWSSPTEARHQTLGSPVYSPDGRFVAIGSAPETDPVLTVYDAATGRAVVAKDFETVECGPTTWSRGWSGDGGLLAVGAAASCDDRSSSFVRVIDTSSWDIVTDLAGAAMPVFSEESGRLTLFEFAVEDDHHSQATVYEAGSFEVVRTVPGALGDISPDGNVIAVSGEGATSTDVYVVEGESHQIDRLPDLDYLPAADATDIVRFVPSGDPDLTPPVPILVVGTEGQSTAVWTLLSGDLLHELPTGGVVGLGFDPLTHQMYTAGVDGSIAVWDVSVGGLSGTHATYPYWFEANGFTSNPASGLGTAMHYNVLNDLSTFAQFDIATGALTSTEIDEVGRTAYQVATLPDGRAAFVAGDIESGLAGPFVAGAISGERSTIHGCESHVREWFEPSAFDQECLDGGEPFLPADAPVTSVDGDVIGALSGPTLFTWDASTLDLLSTSDLTASLVDTGIDFTRAVMRAFDNEWALIQSADGGRLLVVDLATSATIADLDVEAVPFGTEVAPDGSYVLLATDDGAIYRVDVTDWEPRLLIEPTQLIRGVAISRHGDRVMLGGTDGLVHIHDTRTGRLLDRVEEPDVSDGYWIDGDRIAVGTRTGTWTVLDLNILRIAEQALGQLTRGFSPEECERFGIEQCPSVDEMLAALSP